jgi:flagellar protein FlbT
MKNTLKISLKPNEKIYVNGAVIRVDRKVTVEFLNDVHFLLENHVLQPEDASTPLRQLYFIVQVMLMNPDRSEQVGDMFRKSLHLLLATFEDAEICSALKHIDRLVGEDHVFEALKAIRTLYKREEAILRSDQSDKGFEEQAYPIAAGEKY